MGPVYRSMYEKEHVYMFLLPNGILKDFTRTNLLDCPVGTKVYVHDDSEEESRQLVWKYAYPHKSWQLDPKSFDKLLATEYGCYPFLQLKTVKATVLIGSERYMKNVIEGEPNLFFNKNGIRTKIKRTVASLSDLLL
ncbi:hypothetical protein TNCV_1985921 [Trichonephila clavipes]|nr:hypothetical protein TNCV_2441181 [Trichonephila clavipes]GFX64067.1 hypothetical protein TNCV_1985921 [Trichonephila clavipes]